MTNFANIGTFLFGTYDTDLARHWAGDKVAAQIIEKANIDGLKFRKYQLRGLGQALDISGADVNEIISKNNKNPEAILNGLLEKANTTKKDVSSLLDKNLRQKYNMAAETKFGQVSLIDRFKTNFNLAKEEDVVYKFFKGEQKNIFEGFSKEIKTAISGKAGLGKYKEIAKITGKGLGKAMPFIGAALTLGFELPNIFNSFSNYGAGEGLKQTGRAAFNISGFAAGAAAGTILIPIPFVGSLIGGAIGGMVASFASKTIFGESKSEKQSEIEALGISKDQAKELVKQGISVEQLEQQLAQQQAQPNPFGSYPQQQTQPSPFGGYAQQPYQQYYQQPYQAYNHQFQGGSYPKGISLGDENMVNDMNRAYNMYSVA